MRWPRSPRQGTNESARVAAAVALLDRGYGKPSNTMQVVKPQRSVQELTDAELEEIVAAGMAADENPVPTDWH